MWKRLKEFVPCKNTKVWQPNRIEVDGKEETCNRKIAQTFNEYFANIACKLAEKFTGVRKVKIDNKLIQIQLSSLNLLMGHKYRGE